MFDFWIAMSSAAQQRALVADGPRGRAARRLVGGAGGDRAVEQRLLVVRPGPELLSRFAVCWPVVVPAGAAQVVVFSRIGIAAA